MPYAPLLYSAALLQRSLIPGCNHLYVMRVSKRPIFAVLLSQKQDTNSTAGDSSQQGIELAWPPHQHQITDHRPGPDSALAGQGPHPHGGPGLAAMGGVPGSYTDMFTMPNGPTMEASALRGAHGHVSHDAHGYSHANEQYHGSSSKWGGGMGGSALAANAAPIGLGGQWVSSERGTCGSDLGISASEYSANCGTSNGGAAAIGGGGRSGGEMDESMASLMASVSDAATSYPGGRVSHGHHPWSATAACRNLLSSIFRRHVI